MKMPYIPSRLVNSNPDIHQQTKIIRRRMDWILQQIEILGPNYVEELHRMFHRDCMIMAEILGKNNMCVIPKNVIEFYKPSNKLPPMSHKLIHDVSVVLGEVETCLFKKDQLNPFAATYNSKTVNEFLLASERAGTIEVKTFYLTHAAAIIVRMLADMKTVVLVGLLLIATVGRGQSLDTAKARILYDYIASDSLPVTSQVYSVNGYVVRYSYPKSAGFVPSVPILYLTGAKTRIPEKNVWNYKMGW